MKNKNKETNMRNLLVNAGSAAMIALSLVTVIPDMQAKEAYRSSVNYSLLPSYNGEDLELSHDSKSFNFKLWSPFAKEIGRAHV